MDSWFYALLGGVIGFFLFPFSVWLYKKYLSDTSILDFIKEQFKTMMKNRMDTLFPPPPTKSEVDPPRI